MEGDHITPQRQSRNRNRNIASILAWDKTSKIRE